MLDLKRFKEALVSYGMHSPLWSRCLIPGQLRTWLFHKTAILGVGSQFQWKTCLRMVTGQRSRARDMEICQYQPLSKGQYANLQDNLDVMIIPWTYAISNFVCLGLCWKIKKMDGVIYKNFTRPKGSLNWWFSTKIDFSCK